MPDCPNCGHAVNPLARFCETCGSALTPLEHTTVGAAPTIEISAASSPINVMLISTGEQTLEAATDAIADMCGYALADARVLAQSAPVALAKSVTKPAAASLMRALTLRGLQVTAYDSRGYMNDLLTRDLCGKAVSSQNESAAPCALMECNRIERHLMRPWNIPYQYDGEKPPIYIA